MVMNIYSGACSCGLVKIEFSSRLELSDFEARICDCDFCVARNVKYISDSSGHLKLTSEGDLNFYQQGSNQAKFIACTQCDDIICASYKNLVEPERFIGSLNVNLLSNVSLLKNSVTVSPKKLTASDKLERWEQVWMPISFQK